MRRTESNKNQQLATIELKFELVQAEINIYRSKYS